MTPATTPQLNDETVNLQPDVETGGFTFLNELEDSALNAIDVFAVTAAQTAGQGRNPFDPANANFGKLQQPTQTSGISTGLLLVIVALVVLL